MEEGKGKGREGGRERKRGRNLPNQCQTASYVPVPFRSHTLHSMGCGLLLQNEKDIPIRQLLKLSQELKGKIILATFFAKYMSRKRQTYQNEAKNLCTICV